ncbi:hypothetical protein BB469_05785, partial [Helicobacter pylori]
FFFLLIPTAFAFQSLVFLGVFLGVSFLNPLFFEPFVLNSLFLNSLFKEISFLNFLFFVGRGLIFFFLPIPTAFAF